MTTTCRSDVSRYGIQEFRCPKCKTVVEVALVQVCPNDDCGWSASGRDTAIRQHFGEGTTVIQDGPDRYDSKGPMDLGYYAGREDIGPGGLKKG